MNLYEVMNDKEIKLLENAGIKVEDKNYNQDDISRIQNKIIEDIMSYSKNDILNIREKYKNILNKL